MVQTLDVTQLPVLLMVLWVLQLQPMHAAIQLYLHQLMVLYQVKVVQDLKQEHSKQLMLVVILLLHQEL
jgi:hypothetical protein